MLSSKQGPMLQSGQFTWETPPNSVVPRCPRDRTLARDRDCWSTTISFTLFKLYTKRYDQRRLNQPLLQGIYTVYLVITFNSYFQLVLIFPPLTASSQVSSTSATVLTVTLALLAGWTAMLFSSKSSRSSRTQSKASSSRKAVSGMGLPTSINPRPPPVTNDGLW